MQKIEGGYPQSSSKGGTPQSSDLHPGYSISNFHKVHPFFRFCWKLAHIFYNIKLRYPENFSLIGPAVWKLQLSKDWSIWRKMENYYVFGPRLWIRFPKKAMDQSLKYCLSIYTSLGATCLPKIFWGPALLPLKIRVFIFWLNVTPWFTIRVSTNQGVTV